ncbi:MAG: aldehyde dehydrogenase [Pyrinomonadaceae bacterium]
MTQFEKIFIGGEWTNSAGTEVLRLTSPHDGRAVGECPSASQEDIGRAVMAARQSFDQGPWRQMQPEERHQVIARFATLHDGLSDEFAQFITAENGSPLWFTRTVQACIALQNEAYLKVAAEYPWQLEQNAIPAGRTLWRREPVGVVAAIIPWNAPHQSALVKIIPALLAGCSVVLKLAPETALDGQFLGDLFMEAGLPAGVLSILAASREVSEDLVTHPGVDKIAFTGSTLVGQRIAALAGGQLKRVSLELGGKSAAIVLEDADIESTAFTMCYASLANSGQSCTAQSRILVPRNHEQLFIDSFCTIVNGMAVGDPSDPETFVGPLISERQRARVADSIDLGIKEGARIAIGGPGRPERLAQGNYVRPTVFAGVSNNMRIARGEIFGPVVCIIAYDDLTEAIEIANDSSYGLAGSVWTNDTATGLDVARRIRTGVVSINGAGPDFLAPFGGFKLSGLGREFGAEGLGEYIEHQAISLHG